MKIYSKQILVVLISLFCISVTAQVKIDSSYLDRFPTLIGSICFETDSTDVWGGEIPAGSSSEYRIKIKNVGNYPVSFTNGKSNNFISLIFEPAFLNPLDEGVCVVSFESLVSIDTGELITEIAITSDDKKNPYKFLNLHNTILPAVETDPMLIMDSVPNIIFDHYNYDFGHQKRGQRFYHTYVITNRGKEPLLISNIVVPPGIEVIDYPVGEILPGEKIILRIRVNTRGRVGVQHYIVSVYSNDPSDPVVMLGLHGSVKVLPGHKKTSVQCSGSKQRL